MSPTVLVSGATGQLGVFLLPRLQAAGYRVLALSRRAPAEMLEVTERVWWLRPRALAGLDTERLRHFVSCGPLAPALEYVEQLPQLQQAVVFSTSSVLSKADSADRAESQRIAAIATQETRLRERCAERGVALLLLRPTLIWGCGLDQNVSLLARFGRRFGFIPLAGQASGLRQPVHADDLAELAVRALQIGIGDMPESVACGGSTLSYREMAKRIASACGKPVRLLALPPTVLALLVRLASLLPAYRGLNVEMVRRQGRDLEFDDSRLREKLGFAPRAFHPVAGDFEIPDQARRFQLPGSASPGA